ncbi:MAG: phosphate ABC transporter substrate-binding protein [Syntrophomonadaceae bacterium]
MIKRRGKQGVYLALAAVLAVSVFVVGCGQNSQTTPQGSAELQGTITIAGSTSVQPFSEVLAEKFMEKNPKVKVNVQGGGSGQGITAATSGAAQIGSSSRDLTAQEKAQLVETKIAMDGIAVVVNPSNQVENLTADQIRNIFLGNIKNWKEVGGPDTVITVVSREEGSGTRSAFEELLLSKQPVVKTAIVQASTGAVKTTIAGDKNSIGYDSLAAVDATIKALKIDGVDASAANVKNGSYKASRPFIYLTKGQPEGASKAFIDFVMSSEGQQIMSQQGAIPVK